MNAISAQARLLEAVHARGSGPALLWSDRSMSWAELDDRALAAGARLAALGVRAGDRVACYAETDLDVIAALLGAHAAGAIWVPVNPGYQDAELHHIL